MMIYEILVTIPALKVMSLIAKTDLLLLPSLSFSYQSLLRESIKMWQVGVLFVWFSSARMCAIRLSEILLYLFYMHTY